MLADDTVRGVSTPESFEHYLAAWNERDPERVPELLEASVTHAVVFADPIIKTVGLEALADHIVRTRQEYPDATYRRTSAVDGGHDHVYRYTWDVVVDGEVAMTGMDATTVDPRGRIIRIDGFFGPIPPLDD